MYAGVPTTSPVSVKALSGDRHPERAADAEVGHQRVTVPGKQDVLGLDVAMDEAYVQHQLARIYILVGEPEKALDRLEPLLKVPYYLSPGWLRLDPTFDPLRGNPGSSGLVKGSEGRLARVAYSR